MHLPSQTLAVVNKDIMKIDFVYIPSHHSDTEVHWNIFSSNILIQNEKLIIDLAAYKLRQKFTSSHSILWMYDADCNVISKNYISRVSTFNTKWFWKFNLSNDTNQISIWIWCSLSFIQLFWSQCVGPRQSDAVTLLY